MWARPTGESNVDDAHKGCPQIEGARWAVGEGFLLTSEFWYMRPAHMGSAQWSLLAHSDGAPILTGRPVAFGPLRTWLDLQLTRPGFAIDTWQIGRTAPPKKGLAPAQAQARSSYRHGRRLSS